jgi:hypothetical protein
MKLHIFQSNKGDCLLIEAADGALVLCDGGMRSSMKQTVRHELTKLRAAGRELEYVYVSHIDQDHISGVLQLLEDEVAWRVFDFQQSVNHPDAEAPDVPRPPRIKGLLQNAFRDLIGVNESTEVEDLIAVAVPSLLSTAEPRLVDAALGLQDLAQSIPEALGVSRLAAADALAIPVNRLPGATGPAPLLFAGDHAPTAFDVGTMTFTVVGPGRQELTDLKTGWVNWLRANKQTVRDLRRELKRRVEAFAHGGADSPFDLRDWNGIPDFRGVTAPNVASLMFMVEEGGARILLTGDSQQDKILDGLHHTEFLADQGLHVDVLKVQHHGSEHNLDANFAREVSATHYVFCGNGLHGNPDQRVIDHVFESRLGAAANRTKSPAAAQETFHFWFSTTASAEAPDSARRAVFEALEAHVEQLRQASGGRLEVHANAGAAIVLDV